MCVNLGFSQNGCIWGMKFLFLFSNDFFLKMKKYIWVVLYIYLKSFCRFLSEDQPSDKSSNKSCQLDVKTLFYYFLKNITDLLYVIHLQTRGSINLIYKLKGSFWFTFLSYNKPLSYWLSCLWGDNICFCDIYTRGLFLHFLVNILFLLTGTNICFVVMC